MAEPGNVAEYTVSEISMALKRTVEDTYSYVRVRGEVSGFRGVHSSGHCYFTLKDEKARLEAVIWRSAVGKLKFKPEEGLDVIATGRLSTFPGSSKYQIVIEALEPAGVGALMAVLEERRKKLAAEGLFDEARKKPLPYLPRVIGVVTSPTGAVIRDILHRLADRFPVRVLVWPVRVQGETSAAEVAAAIRGFNALGDGAVPRPDLLIVARGGGSLEDLWGFNEEVVVRAAAESEIPLISAVGHETDTTLIDFAADRRAPTPTGAAEIAVPVRSELLAAVDALARRHAHAVTRSFEQQRRALRAAARALPSLEGLFGIPRRRVDDLSGRLGGALRSILEARKTAFAGLRGRLSFRTLSQLLRHERQRLGAGAGKLRQIVAYGGERRRVRLQTAAGRLSARSLMRIVTTGDERLALAGRRGHAALMRTLERDRSRVAATWQLLKALSYTGVLERGFALVVDEANIPVRSAAAVSPGMALTIEFQDGKVGAIASGEAPATKPKPRGKVGGPGSSQGDLF